MYWADGMAWLHFCGQYQRLFGVPVPDWACCLEMRRKLRLVRTACALRMPLAETVLVRNEANDMTSLWG